MTKLFGPHDYKRLVPCPKIPDKYLNPPLRPGIKITINKNRLDEQKEKISNSGPRGLEQIGPVSQVLPLCYDTRNSLLLLAGLKFRALRAVHRPRDLSVLTPFAIRMGNRLEYYDRMSSEEWLTAKKKTYDSSKLEKYRVGLLEETFASTHRDCFMKAETYTKAKAPRSIQSGSFRTKGLLGRYMTPIEDKLFKLPQFVKKIPYRQRPQYIEEYLAGYGYIYVLDYTSFECSHSRKVFEAVEYPGLWQRMAQKYPEFEKLLTANIRRGVVLKDMAGVFRVSGVKDCRFSGDMQTSSGNGFVNSVLCEFILALNDTAGKYVVEGDDAILVSRDPLTNVDLSSFGFDLDIERKPSLGACGFCSLYWTTSMVPFDDPLGFLMNIGLSSACPAGASVQVRQELLNAKCLSYCYASSAAPIIGPICRALMQGDVCRFPNTWYFKYEVEKLNLVVIRENSKWIFTERPNVDEVVSEESRIDFLSMFGWTPAEQREVEARFPVDGYIGPLQDQLDSSLQEANDKFLTYLV